MKFSQLSLALASAALLAACGGGGGGGNAPSPAATATPTPATVAVSANIVTSVPAPTYTAVSEELAAFNLLNAERDRCGFGKLTQNTALDTAARGHADWLLINGYTGHYQNAGTTGFTGVAPADRAVAASYGVTGSFNSTEVETDRVGPKTGNGVVGVRGLLNAPYHLLVMLRGYRDVGISVRDQFDVGLSPNNRNVLNIDMGAKNSDGLQVAATDSVRTYPCDGTTGIDRSLTGEYPSPAAGRDLLTSPLGTTIGVAVDIGSTLAITSASMIKVATGTTVTLRAPVVAANDPNATASFTYINKNEGVVSADAPLEASTQYQVTITGSSNGTAFSRTFTFTTGA